MLLAGCVPSLQPYYTAKDLVWDQALVGEWVAPKDGDWLVVRRAGEKQYEVRMKPSPEDPAVFEARLLELGDMRFVDLYPAKPHLSHTIAVHSVYKLERRGDTLRLAGLDESWLKKMIRDGKLQIAHELVDNDLLLTAPTARLQELITRYAGDVQAFPGPQEYRRK